MLIVPQAPATFSITAGSPIEVPTLSAAIRKNTAVEPPAANGNIHFNGRVGKTAQKGGRR